MGISSLLSAVKNGGRPNVYKMALTPLDPFNNDTPIDADRRYFQYWPDTITSSKQTNWEKKIIPGLSHPLYQWIAGDAHEISFTVVFSRDTAPDATQSKLITNPASSNPMSKATSPRDVDIPSAVAWLRQFVYPDYGGFLPGTPGVNLGGARQGQVNRPKAPRKLILLIPNLHLGLANNLGHPDQIVVIMTQCEVSYEGFFSDGAPRLAKVQLQFAETIQVGGRIQVQDAYAFRSVGRAGYTFTQSNQDKKQT